MWPYPIGRACVSCCSRLAEKEAKKQALKDQKLKEKIEKKRLEKEREKKEKKEQEEQEAKLKQSAAAAAQRKGVGYTGAMCS